MQLVIPAKAGIHNHIIYRFPIELGMTNVGAGNQVGNDKCGSWQASWNDKIKPNALESWNSVTTESKKLSRRHRDTEEKTNYTFWNRKIKHNLKGQ